MKTLAIIVSGILIFFLRSGAQIVRKDSAKTYEMKEMVVTATKSPVSVTDAPSSVDIIGVAQLQLAGGNSVADVLKTVPGVFIREYGSMAAMKTLSIRGASSEHVLVLLNGNRINSFQNSLVDLSLLPLGNVERIEIVRGGSAALYGSDAMGGVVNIITKKPTGGLKLRTEGSLGSYAFQRYALEGQGRAGPIGIVAGYSEDRGKDDYQFSFRDSGIPETTLQRGNADFHRRLAFLSGTANIREDTRLSVSTQRVVADRGVPGAVMSAAGISAARQNDDDVTVSSVLDYQGPKSVVFTLRSMFHYNLERYIDPDPSYPINSYYHNTYLTLSPQFEFLLGNGLRCNVGGEYSDGFLTGNDFDATIRRIQRALYLSGEAQWKYERQFFDRISFFETVRLERTAGVGDAIVPKVGVNVRLVRNGDIRLRATAGENYRTPSFNDLYYRGFSNPLLRPERSTSFDAGLTATFLGNRTEQTMEATYFLIEMEDRIQFDPSLFIPVNIGRTRSVGMELVYRGQFFGDAVRLKVSYSMNDVRKKNRDVVNDPAYDRQLKFVPRHLGAMEVMFRSAPVSLSIIHALVGERFVDDQDSRYLPGYAVTGVNFNADITFSGYTIIAKAEVNDLFAVSYEVFPNYPMPQRIYRFTVGVEY